VNGPWYLFENANLLYLYSFSCVLKFTILVILSSSCTFKFEIIWNRL
jgi:hypothetical protein